MSAADSLAQTKFGDIVFPSEMTRLGMQFRHHVHEYPHTPGGAAEKLGRGLYRVTVRASFQATFAAYPGLYPDAMNKMRAAAENGLTQTFVHPSAGSFPAFIIDWNQEKDAKLRSGEKVDITFLEDQEATFSLASTPASSVQTIVITAAQLAADLAKVKASLALTATNISVFDALQSAVNAVTAISDQASLYSNLYAAKLQNVANLCSQIDQMSTLDSVTGWVLVDSVLTIWATTVQILQDTQAQQVQVKTYTVPFTQPIAQVAMAIYGDATRGGDLLGLNVILDPMAVPAGAVLKYYPAS